MKKSNFYGHGKAAASSNKDDWETPQSLYEELDKKYIFDLDVASSHKNHKAKKYYTQEENGLEKEWRGSVFCNPPYGRTVINQWLQKAYIESLKEYNEQVVMLIPARTGTNYWHEHVFGKASVHFLRGRLKFENNGMPGESSPFDSAVLVFKKEEEPKIHVGL